MSRTSFLHLGGNNVACAAGIAVLDAGDEHAGERAKVGDIRPGCGADESNLIGDVGHGADDRRGLVTDRKALTPRPRRPSVLNLMRITACWSAMKAGGEHREGAPPMLFKIGMRTNRGCHGQALKAL
jgi:hypothetical protein